MSKRQKPVATMGMPSLTIEGKRTILKLALKSRGEKVVTLWLNSRGIPSVRYLHEKVRQYKMAFFKDLYDWGSQLD